MSAALRADYRDVLQLAETDRSTRALILTGSGGSFCAGGDVNVIANMQDDDQSERSLAAACRQRLIVAHQWLERLRALDVPVIAAVDGPAAGAGASLAFQADFVLASTRAYFCLSFAKIGLVPDFGAYFTLPRLVGLSMAKELMMTGRRFDAAEARSLGIVHAIHDPEVLLDEARRFAARLAAGPRDALGMIKNSLNRSFESDYRTMAEIEGHQQAVAMSSPFHAAAVRSFLDKRPLQYDWDRADAAR